jgi:hypothetical protein
MTDLIVTIEHHHSFHVTMMQATTIATKPFA